MGITFGAKTDVGLKREANEDSYGIEEDLGLFLVADGMGGHAAGEIASRMAVNIIRENLAKSLHNRGAIMGKYKSEFSLAANQLASSIRLANRAVYEAAKDKPEYSGMGTTIVGILTQGRTVVFANVGDSRIYRIRNFDIEQISEDHSLVMEQIRRGIITKEEAKRSRFKNIITRALGIAENVQITLDEQPIFPGDYLLLCCDGLHTLVDDHEMLEIVLTCKGDLDSACHRMVHLANERGGHDNITVVLVCLQSDWVDKIGLSWLKRFFRANLRGKRHL
ncbi:MAG: Stp1/IreP family PP2C-type Ser/Thr phosphatase [Candidatus Tectomicrobia bacterium]|nr:Stp1/IreP family PP2C-type Ser/Thr phosphatase [Candidatus Tectomicrobia bacterium]